MPSDSQLSPHATLTAGQGGLQKIVIDHPLAAGEVYLHGAHVTHWQPAGHEPVLYLSPLAKFVDSKAIRGGIPICLPWFGPLAGFPDAPAHGLVRTRGWELIDVTEDESGVTVRLGCDIPANAALYWDNEFAAELSVTFGATLAIVLAVANTGDTAMSFEEALHTYYRVGNAANVTVTGLHNVTYLDRPSGGSVLQQIDPAIHFTGETDRVYVDTDMTCVIHDPDLRREITIEKDWSNSTVVWNPAVQRATELADIGPANWADFVCIETANTGDDAIKLVAGVSHEMVLNVSVARL